MKIVIAPDSFKESLSAAEVAKAIARGVFKVFPKANVIHLPMADGGEGTLDALLLGTTGQARHTVVVDALGRPCASRWGWIAPDTAFIEMASAAGLEQIPIKERDIMQADTSGVGQLIVQALDHGARTIVLTAGGSATNDGGAGMLKALGLSFLGASGEVLKGTPEALKHLSRIDTTTFDERIKSVRWIVATDVDNPLCGERGASAIFGPQKGACAEQVAQLDQILSRFADITRDVNNVDVREHAGAGAGGGIGFAAMAWLDAEVRPGAELVAELVQLDSHVATADLVITGEGKMDAQTLYGKAPMQVIRTANQHKVPVIGIAGSLGAGYEALYAHGLGAAFSLTSGPMTLEQACAHAPALLEQRSQDIMRALRLGADVLPTRSPAG